MTKDMTTPLNSTSAGVAVNSGRLNLQRNRSMTKSGITFCLLWGLIGLTGCQGLGTGFGGPRSKLRQTQLQALNAYNRSQMLQAELGSAQQMAAQLSSEKMMADAHAADLEGKLAIANERLTNLANERSKLHDEYRNLLTNLPSPDANRPNRRFEELCRKYPQFEFDPITGVSRFNVDIRFESGSNELSPEGYRALQEFASIMNDADARQFNILVVGHTDDETVVRPETRAKHETNWELSAHRATAVVRQLAKIGVAEPRMGVAGYNKFQPAAPNSSANSKSKNRRVELFVLAPDAAIAGRENSVSMK